MDGTRSYRAMQGIDFVFRPLQPEDLPEVLEIERQGYARPWSESVFLDCFRDNYRLWAICHGDRLVGYAIVAYQFDEAHLLNLCVGRASRGQGAGRELLRYLVARSIHDGMHQVLLEVRRSNEGAAALYLSEGFEEIGVRPGYYPGVDGAEDARVMKLDLHT
ncbi:ribosomal-protein-alanine acetyltransferase [Marinobacter santoriniensis NKSG1]|uniref:[Ribosomal protein bS18]-alanine N-acetyltransferase n=1 Tax=Marinobacter santoriniensis NKSG1 TaxID=1288826 RepID=M7DIJ5_9GAMM|nr:ribosomal protein S18-alanine N-acetyltransferase [Marinobacter santoriniensis]EMP57487.1 ribosomal-protein-alanine acetyltransferase [Marinobacter santoriniensis NKSG1]